MIRGLIALTRITRSQIQNNCFISNQICLHKFPLYPKLLSINYIHTTRKFNQDANEIQLPNDEDRKVKILKMEIEYARQQGRRAPDPESLKDDHWKHLLSLNTRSARRKYYSFLWQLEKRKENTLVKKEKRKEEIAERKAKEAQEVAESNHIIYGLGYTSFLLRVYDTTINSWGNNRLIQAMRFGQKLVIDCSYDDNMVQREAINTAKQLMLCFANNRTHDEPFDMHFCNTKLEKPTMEHLKKHIPTMLESWFPLHIHEQCYTELFPKDRLVYLTPHSRTVLHEYNHDDIYIVGAMVDKTNSEPLSLAKAKRLGLRMAKLPLDKYLQWGGGSGKSLTINQMIQIMLDIKKTNDWNYSLRHVPRRKIVDMKDEEREEKFRQKLKLKFNDYKVNLNTSDENENRDKRRFKSKFSSNKFDMDTWGLSHKKQN